MGCSGEGQKPDPLRNLTYSEVGFESGCCGFGLKGRYWVTDLLDKQFLMSNQIQSNTDRHITETYKGLITLGVETLKIIFVLNAGALVACLTFLRNQAGQLAKKPPLPIPEMLRSYLLGLTLTALAFILAYLMQLSFLYEQIANSIAVAFGSPQ